jgi:hypothetical protein
MYGDREGRPSEIVTFTVTAAKRYSEDVDIRVLEYQSSGSC